MSKLSFKVFIKIISQPRGLELPASFLVPCSLRCMSCIYTSVMHLTEQGTDVLKLKSMISEILSSDVSFRCCLTTFVP